MKIFLLPSALRQFLVKIVCIYSMPRCKIGQIGHHCWSGHPVGEGSKSQDVEKIWNLIAEPATPNHRYRWETQRLKNLRFSFRNIKEQLEVYYHGFLEDNMETEVVGVTACIVGWPW